jgi:hypothetical protein
VASGKLIQFLRHNRNRQDRDPLLDQSARFLHGRFAANMAVRNIALVHLAGFARKSVSDIFAFAHHFVAESFQKLACLDLPLVEKDHVLALRGSRTWGIASPAHERWRHDGFRHLGGLAHGAGDEPPGGLRVEIRAPAKPALEPVTIAANQSVTNHWGTCALSGRRGGLIESVT